MTTEGHHPEDAPRAIVEHAPVRTRLSGLIWLVPLAAVALSIGFAVQSVGSRGPLVTVLAEHGYGLGAGDAVRHLGIEVGRIESAGLADASADGGVRLEVRLAKDASALAREGTRFWIVRPEISLDSVEGLDTLIGAQYLALAPGPVGAPPRDRFTALSDIPLADELDGDRGMEIVLEARTRFGLQVGAAITYRGVQIGTVTAVGLASDATTVEVRARIRGAYEQLVRQRSVFWETGGFELALSLADGLEVDLDSIRNAIVGGIAMATPVDAGPVASSGARYPLADDPEPDWLEWAPALPLGSDLLPAGAEMPRLVRATLRWSAGRILKSEESLEAWLQVTDEGLVGPADVFEVPGGARDGRATLQVVGRDIDLGALEGDGRVTARGDSLAVLAPEALGDAFEGLLGGAPRLESRGLSAPEDLILVREAGRDPIGVDASRVVVDGSGVTIDPVIPISAEWHGAVALARDDGRMVGTVLSGPGDVRVRIVRP